MEMCPKGFEVQGKWGQSTYMMFQYITKRMNNINNACLLPKSFSTSYWRLKIWLTLQAQVSSMQFTIEHSKISIQVAGWAARWLN